MVPTDRDEKIRELMTTQPFAVLATKGEHPHTSLVSFIADEGLDALYFPTSRDTRKYRNMLSDPRVALMADDRGSDPMADIRRASSVTAAGTAEECGDEESAAVAERFIERHPYLEDFVRDPGTAIIRVDVKGYDVISSFQG